MINKVKLSMVLGLLIAGGASAQQDGPPPSIGMHGGGPMGAGHFGGGHKVVTGVPYSADTNSQSVQTLADGNSISRTTTGHVARDSQGRTYTQETISGGFVGANGPFTAVFISDPVAGYLYRLNTSTKTASRSVLPTPPTSASGTPAGPPAGRGSAAGTDVQTTDLGTQTINGVSAQGTSRTRTTAAGAMGNTAPIVSTGELWYSPDLQVVVQAKHSDPRMGQSTYSLTNIQRTEPAASLFQVPSDYTVQDAKFGGDHGPMH